jgi:hypothetical protein
MTAQSKKGTLTDKFKKGLAIVAAITVLGTTGGVIAGTLTSCENPVNNNGGTQIVDEYDAERYNKKNGFNKERNEQYRIKPRKIQWI